MNFKILNLSQIEAGKYDLRFKSIKKEIDSLADSIKKNGLICPPTVSKKGNKYYIISGNRRFKAVKKLGWKEMPCAVLEEVGDKESLVKSVVENIERVNLSPLERAKAYRELIEEYGSTEEELAEKIGVSRPAISNHLRLLGKLNSYVLEWLHQGKIFFGHALILMKLEDKKKQLEICKRVIDEDLSIKDTALLVDQARPVGELTEREKELNKIEKDIMKSLKNEWGKKINIRQGRKAEKLMVEFTTREELRELLEKISKSLK